MSVSVYSSRFARWNHRILGGVWALFGFLMLAGMVSHLSWESEYQQWIALLLPATLIGASAWFSLGGKWGRRTMSVLMALAALLFLDLLLMSGFNGNRAGVWEMFSAFLVAGYTLLYLFVSEISRFADSRLHPNSQHESTGQQIQKPPRTK